MSDISSDLKKLQEGYIERLKTSIMVFENNFLKRHAGNTSKEDLLGAVHMLHGLAGTGATFGFPAVSTVARQAELFLAEAIRPLDTDDRLNDEQFTVFLESIARLRDVCVIAVNGGVQQEAPSPEPAESVAESQTSGSFRILIVDDDPDIAGALAAALRAAGHQADQAHNRDEAMQKIRAQHPDLVTLDILMPGQNGHVILREIKSNPSFSSIPIIMMSAKIEDRHVQGALEYGAVDYIFKPANPSHVVQKIERILRSKDRSVMIVDNDDFILKLMETKLRHTGYRVVVAENGLDAMEIIGKSKPDIVLMDMLMPGMDGLTCVRQLRQTYTPQTLPVIVMSTNDDPMTRRDVVAAGAQEYHTKPFNIDDMIISIRRVMNQAA